MSSQGPIDFVSRPAIALFGLLALGIAGTTFWNHRQARQELLRMRSAERHVLYEHVLGTLIEVCARGNAQNLTEYCGAQARYVALFPECDESCHHLSRRFSPLPTK